MVQYSKFRVITLALTIENAERFDKGRCKTSNFSFKRIDESTYEKYNEMQTNLPQNRDLKISPYSMSQLQTGNNEKN